jgi:hypothetical protein
MTRVHIPARLRGYRPRYADVTATLALLFAMGGTAYAATSLGPHTVGTAQLKDHAVTNHKIDTHAVSAGRIAPGAVTDGKLADGSVTSTKLGDGAVTHSTLGINSIDGGDVAPNSISLADLVGADVKGVINLSLGAHTCASQLLDVPGARLGQLVLFSFIGTTAMPGSVTFGGAKVPSDDHVTVKDCNVSGSNVSVSSLGIRIATFG